MTTDRTRPTGESGDHAPDAFEKAIGDYLDRLNSGKSLDPKEVLAENPLHGPQILETLKEFVDLDSTASNESDAQLGALGDYTLRRQIGRGGVVYEAWENSMDRAVALKVLPAGIAADDRAVARFTREARLAGKLNHDNIVRVYSTGVREGTPWYSMELVEGETLAQILAKLKDAEPETDTPFGKKDQVGYFAALATAFADVADGLQNAHSKGVVHRDIKPSNLILDVESDRRGSLKEERSGGRGPRLRILDFGLARLEGQESLTLSGDFVGTPLYMSPEQARRRKISVDHRTDVYSLGATMYEVLTGKPPFRGKNHADTLSQIIERDPVEPRKLNPRMQKDLATIVLKCLRKDAADRYGTAEALAQDLRRFVRGDPIEARPQSPLVRVVRRVKRQRFALLGLASTLLLLSVCGWLLWWNLRESSLRRLAERTKAYDDYGSVVMEAAVTIHRRSIKPGGGRWSALSPERWRLIPFHDEVVLDDTDREVAEEIAARLARVSRQVPDRPEAFYYRARVLLLLGRHREAAELLEWILGLSSRFVPARFLLARLQGESGVAGTETTRAESGAWTELWLDAETAVREERWHEAKQVYGAMLAFASLNGGDPYVGFVLEALMGRAFVCLRSQDLEGAIRDLTRVNFGWPELTEPGLLLAKAYHQHGRPEEAARVVEELYRNTGESDEVALWIGDIYYALGEFDTSLAWAARIREEYLKNTHTGIVQLRQRKLRESVRDLRQALAIDPPKSLEAIGRLGLCRALWENLQGRTGPKKEREVRELLEHSGRALDIVTPRWKGSAQKMRTLALLESGDVEGAVDLSVSMSPASQKGLETRAIVHNMLGRHRESVAACREWLRGKQNEGEAYYFLGLALGAQGQNEAASAALGRAIELEPDWSWPLAALGGVYIEMGKYQEAIEACRKGIDRPPVNSAAWENLAYSLWKAEQPEKALEVVSRGLRLVPDRAGLNKARELILAARASWVEAPNRDP